MGRLARRPDGRVYLVDWDKAWLDDPALDVSMLLYWYIDPALWPVFCASTRPGATSGRTWTRC